MLSVGPRIVWDPGTLETLMSDVLEVSYLLIPLSICLAVWLDYHNRSQTFTGLGLNEASIVSETQRRSWPWRLVYLSTLTLTFVIGVLTSHLSNFIGKPITTLLK
jgi:hypothetical protein